MKITLPEKKFFSIAELAKRWQVNDQDVQHLIDNRELKTAQKMAAIHGKRTIFWGYRGYQVDKQKPCFLPFPSEADKTMWAEVMRPDQFLIDVPFSFNDEPSSDPYGYNMAGRIAASKLRDSMEDELELVVLLGDVLAFEAMCADGEREISTKERATLLNIVGGLVFLMLNKSPSGKPMSTFETQASIIDALDARFAGKQGMSKRNLESKFSEGTKSLGE